MTLIRTTLGKTIFKNVTLLSDVQHYVTQQFKNVIIRITALSIKTLRKVTMSIITLSIMTLSIISLFET
jgi:hypothetical protein